MSLLVDPIDSDPLVLAARRVADDVLAPAAAAVDATVVPRSHLDALAAAGLLGLDAPRRVGGVAAPAALARRVSELLAGADLATWFVQEQHHGPVRALAEAGGFDPLLADLAAGRQVAGIALSHLRRWPARPLAATPDGAGGWRLDGSAPWYTGWGLNDVALVAALTPDDQVLLVLLPARPGPGLAASDPLDVAALRAAVTVTLTFAARHVPAEAVVRLTPVPDWLAADATRTANVNPAVFGVADAALTLVLDEAQRRREPVGREAALRLAERVRQVRAEAYHLLDHVEPARQLQRRLQLRAQAQQLLVEAASAAVVAASGGAMLVGAPAQRKAREALFLLVQAQTAASRAANLDVLGR